jgi:alpha-galactosidase
MQRIFPAILALACATSYGQSLTGRWVGQASPYDNGLEIVVALNQGAGGSLTGNVQGSRSNDTITSGKVDGDKFTLEAERPGRGGGAPQKVTYTGVVANGKIKLTMPAFGGRGPGGPGRGPGPGGAPPGGGGRGGQPQVIELTRESTAVPEPLPPPAPLVKLALPAPVKANGLAKTPPMGWNSWNKFRNQVSDAMVREMADAIVKSGMRDAGYIYVNIDDTWQAGHRDANGDLQPNNKFPDMKKLADYVHGKGLKLGIYSSPGPRTCAGYLGSYQHEAQDAKLYAKWGIDYLKYDWCSAGQVYANDRETMVAAYAKMGQALVDSGRPILYALCQYGNHDVGEWGASVGGNVWRTTGDIRDAWQSMMNIGFNLQPGREKFARPGNWNDPDMLEVGNGGMSVEEYTTHMSLWSILAAPLLAGNDIRDMKPEIAAILMNKEVIAVNQDKLGKQGVRVAKEGDTQVWSKPLADGSVAVGLFNLGDKPATVSAKWSDLALTGAHKVRDLWKHADAGSKSGEFSAEVPSHGVVMVRIAK